MKINLRKADTLQHEIKAALRAIPMPVSIKVTEFEDGETAIASAKKAAQEGRQRREGLLSAQYEIRRKVGEANAEIGIGDELSRLAEIDDHIGMLRGLVVVEARRLDPEVISGKLEKIKAAPADGGGIYGRSDDTVTTGIFDKSEIGVFEAEIAALRREHREIKDSLLGKNVSTTITLSVETNAILEKAGIL